MDVQPAQSKTQRPASGLLDGTTITLHEGPRPRIIINLPDGGRIEVEAALRSEWNLGSGPIELSVRRLPGCGASLPAGHADPAADAYVPLPDGRSIPIRG